MRTIKFKAKRVDNGEWTVGDLSQDINEVFIFPLNECGNIKVDLTTVCQFTGLIDKNGVGIWEGDKITHNNSRFFQYPYSI